jgi:hypothetical protein
MAFKNDVFFSAELRNGDYHENDSLSGLAQDLINSYSEEPCLLGYLLRCSGRGF